MKTGGVTLIKEAATLKGRLWTDSDQRSHRGKRRVELLCSASISGDIFGLAFKCLDEPASDDLAFFFRIPDPTQGAQKQFSCFDMDERNIIMATNRCFAAIV